MKKYMMIPLAIATLLMPFLAVAHDEGHGPKLTDAGKHGGIVAPVIDSKEAEQGAHAHLVYKAELVISDDGTARVYFYDKEMKPLEVESKFGKTASGVVEVIKKKDVKTTPFSLTLEDGVYVGMAPKATSKPFNIDVRVKEGERELLVGFDNLD
jgi:hypothetical protein